MSKLFFYTKNQFFNFKSAQITVGFEFLSMSQLVILLCLPQILPKRISKAKYLPN